MLPGFIKLSGHFWVLVNLRMPLIDLEVLLDLFIYSRFNSRWFSEKILEVIFILKFVLLNLNLLTLKDK